LFTLGAALVLAFLVLAVPLVRLLGLTLALTLRTVFLARRLLRRLLALLLRPLLAPLLRRLARFPAAALSRPSVS
jgi:hypothetical protein